MAGKTGKTSSEPRSIEFVEALKEVEVLGQRTIIPPQLSKLVRQGIAQKLGQSRRDIEKRLAGLRAEDEFMLLSLLLGNVEQATRLNQKQLVNWVTYGVPDLLITVRFPKQFTRDERRIYQRFFVEVKTTEDQRVFLLAEDVFEKLVKFSQLYRPVPLYFAIRLGPAGSPGWYLVSADSLLKTSRRVRANVRGREEDCFSVDVVDLLKEDFTGMWLSNYAVLIPKGFIIKTVYSDTGEGTIFDEKYGRLVRIEVRGSRAQKVFEVRPGVENILLQEVLRRLQVGDELVKQTSTGREVTYVCDVDYFLPFYWLVLSTYLDMREKFEPYVVKRPSRKPTVDYFLHAFSDFDRNLCSAIRNVIWKLQEDGLILAIRMIPGRLHTEE